MGAIHVCRIIIREMQAHIITSAASECQHIWGSMCACRLLAKVSSELEDFRFRHDIGLCQHLVNWNFPHSDLTEFGVNFWQPSMRSSD
ncbi:MAG: hypothetical protein ACREOZ_04160 [Gloeomargaritales cyanobacterium]